MMARFRSRYVDPDTGGWKLTSAKNYQRVDAELGWVYAMLMTERGSIVELPWFGSNLRKITHTRPGVTREIEAAIDEALRPFVGKRFSSYKRRVWLQSGSPLLAVEIAVDGVTKAVEIPLAVE